MECLKAIDFKKKRRPLWIEKLGWVLHCKSDQVNPTQVHCSYQTGVEMESWPVSEQTDLPFEKSRVKHKHIQGRMLKILLFIIFCDCDL